MIQITDKLIAVLVPEDAYNFTRFNFGNNHCIQWEVDNKYDDTVQIKSDFNIIGTIAQSGQFDFDCEKYVYINGSICYNNRVNHKIPFYSKDLSFLSLLNSKGIFLDQLQNQKVLILEKI